METDKSNAGHCSNVCGCFRRPTPAGFLGYEEAEYIERKETTIFKLIDDLAFIACQTDCTKSQFFQAPFLLFYTFAWKKAVYWFVFRAIGLESDKSSVVRQSKNCGYCFKKPTPAGNFIRFKNMFFNCLHLQIKSLALFLIALKKSTKWKK